MKKILSVILVASFFAVSAMAQLGTNTSVVVSAPGGVYGSTFNGGTNVISGGTTNTYWQKATNTVVTSTATNSYTNAVPTVQWNVSQHANVGLSVNWFTPNNTTTNGSNVFKLVKSYDNARTFETSPSVLLTNILPTAVQQVAIGTGNTNTVVYDIDVKNATHIGLVEIDGVGTANLTNYSSNLFINLNMNNPTTWTVPSPR